MFEQAARLKLRFETIRGFLSVEDLWDLPLQTARPGGVSLDEIAIALHRRIKNVAETSFVDETPKPDVETQLGFDIVKHIIAVKKAENAAALAARDKAATKQRILEIIAKKQDETLAASSIEELQRQLETL